jgi:hypothetical protein
MAKHSFRSRAVLPGSAFARLAVPGATARALAPASAPVRSAAYAGPRQTRVTNETNEKAGHPVGP